MMTEGEKNALPSNNLRRRSDDLKTGWKIHRESTLYPAPKHPDRGKNRKMEKRKSKTGECIHDCSGH